MADDKKQDDKKEDKPKTPKPGDNDNNVKDLKANYESVLGDGKPGWVTLMGQQLEEFPGAKAFSLATVDQSSQPRARYVILRSKPVTSASNFLIITSDTRMRKGGQIASNDKVEGVFWMEGSGIQFRIAGTSVMLDENTLSGKASNGQDLKETLKKMGAKGEEATLEFWEQERQKQWKEMSGHLRASFTRPTPGTPLKDLKDGEKPGDWKETIKPEGETDEDKAIIARAKSVFSLVVISPSTFECIELNRIPNTRNLWTKDANGSWSVEGLCP